MPADFVCFTVRWWWQGDWRGEGEQDLKWSAGGRRFVLSAGLFCFSEHMTKSLVPSTTAVMVVLLLILMDDSMPEPNSVGGAGSLDGLSVPKGKCFIPDNQYFDLPHALFPSSGENTGLKVSKKLVFKGHLEHIKKSL